MEKYYVYYSYDKVERTRIQVGFETKKYQINKKIGEYETQNEACRHPLCEEEKEFPKGMYIITKEQREEKVEIQLSALDKAKTKLLDKKQK